MQSLNMTLNIKKSRMWQQAILLSTISQNVESACSAFRMSIKTAVGIHLAQARRINIELESATFCQNCHGGKWNVIIHLNLKQSRVRREWTMLKLFIHIICGLVTGLNSNHLVRVVTSRVVAVKRVLMRSSFTMFGEIWRALAHSKGELWIFIFPRGTWLVGLGLVVVWGGFDGDESFAFWQCYALGMKIWSQPILVNFKHQITKSDFYENIQSYFIEIETSVTSSEFVCKNHGFHFISSESRAAGNLLYFAP